MYARVQAMFRASGVEQLDNATFEHAVRVLVLHQQYCSTTSYPSQSEPLEEPRGERKGSEREKIESREAGKERKKEGKNTSQRGEHGGHESVRGDAQKGRTGRLREGETL